MFSPVPAEWRITLILLAADKIVQFPCTAPLSCGIVHSRDLNPAWTWQSIPLVRSGHQSAQVDISSKKFPPFCQALVLPFSVIQLVIHRNLEIRRSHHRGWDLPRRSVGTRFLKLMAHLHRSLSPEFAQNRATHAVQTHFFAIIWLY